MAPAKASAARASPPSYSAPNPPPKSSVAIRMPASASRSTRATIFPRAWTYGSTVVICEPMWAWTPARSTQRAPSEAAKVRQTHSARSRSTPNFVSFLPVVMKRCVRGSTSGLTRRAARARRPVSRARRARFWSSCSLSTLNMRMPASRA